MGQSPWKGIFRGIKKVEHGYGVSFKKQQDYRLVNRFFSPGKV